MGTVTKRVRQEKPEIGKDQKKTLMDMTVYNFADRDPQKAAIAIRSRVEQEGQEGMTTLSTSLFTQDRFLKPLVLCKE